MIYDFVVSIPVHEQPKVILDQALNIVKYLGEKTMIVLHISRDFNFRNLFENDLSFLVNDNIAINFHKLPTTKGNLVHVHNSNFNFAKNNFEFKYFILHSSNDMYIRYFAGDYINKVKNGIHQIPTSNELKWPQYLLAIDDEDLKQLMKYLDIKEIFGTQPEGIFFEKGIFQEMVNVIDKFYKFGNCRFYCREEIYYSTIISKFTKNISTPLLYSEVCRNKITRKIILGLANGTYTENEYENKGSGEYRLYDFNNLYAVKRINRKINDNLRKLIRSLK